MILQRNSIHRKAGVAIFKSDKIDFKITVVTSKERWTFYNDKRDTTARRHNTS